MLGVPQSALIFLLLWIALAALPLLWASRAASAMQRDERVFRLTFVVAPLLLGLLWVHGVFFETATWWQLRADAFIRERVVELLVIAAPGVLAACVLAYRGAKAIDIAWNRRTAAISYGSQICAWLLLRRLPAAIVEARSVSLQAEPLALGLLVPLPVIAIAFLFARQAIERRATA